MDDQKNINETSSKEKKTEPSQGQPTPEGSRPNPDLRTTYGLLEQIGTWFDGVRAWLLKSWKLSMLMGKGAYIVGERKRLFQKLGESVYYKISRGEIQSIELEPLVQQLDRLTKKIEIEEILVRSVRFGGRSSRPAPNESKDS